MVYRQCKQHKLNSVKVELYNSGIVQILIVKPKDLGNRSFNTPKFIGNFRPLFPALCTCFGQIEAVIKILYVSIT